MEEPDATTAAPSVPKSAREFTGDLTGARFTDADLTDALFSETVLTRARMQGVVLDEVVIDGAIRNLVVNGVRVDELVRAEWERREPDRALLRGTTVVELTRGWEAARGRWLATEQLLASLPAAASTTRVGGEWSPVETIRHLVFVTDAWFRRAVLGLPRPFDPRGLAPHWLPHQQAIGLDPATDPTLDELIGVRADQAEQIGEWLEQASDADLELPGPASDEPGWPEDPSQNTLGDSLRVLLNEEWEHHRFCRRDLTLAGYLDPDADLDDSTR